MKALAGADRPGWRPERLSRLSCPGRSEFALFWEADDAWHAFEAWADALPELKIEV